MPINDLVDYDDLNPGIRRTVRLLRNNGFDTCDSGDGRTHVAECDRDYPYVVIRVEPREMLGECHRLVEVLEDAGVRVLEQGGDYWAGPCVQLNYDPVNRMAFLDLTGMDDTYLEGQ